jgi:hypothetical protein
LDGACVVIRGQLGQGVLDDQLSSIREFISSWI